MRLPVFNIGEFENSAGASREKFCTDLISFIAAIKTQDSSKESLRRLKHQFVAHIEPDPTRPMSDWLRNKKIIKKIGRS